MGAGRCRSEGVTVVKGVAVFLGVTTYCVPSIVALVRHRRLLDGPRPIGSIIMINLLFGWTIAGFLVALAMSLEGVSSTSKWNWLSYRSRRLKGPRWLKPPMLSEHVRVVEGAEEEPSKLTFRGRSDEIIEYRVIPDCEPTPGDG